MSARVDLRQALRAMSTETQPRHDAYENLLRRCREIEPIVTAVAYPCEQTALAGAIEAAEEKLISPILVGPRETIREIAKQARLNIEPYEIEDVAEPRAAAAKAVELIRAGRAELLMKG